MYSAVYTAPAEGHAVPCTRLRDSIFYTLIYCTVYTAAEGARPPSLFAVAVVGGHELVERGHEPPDLLDSVALSLQK